MHMTIANDTAGKAYPLFGLNAPDTLGTLLVTARSDSQTGLVAVLPYAPPGQTDAEGVVTPTGDVTGMAVFMTVIVSEGGVCFDGVRLSDVAYLYFASNAEQVVDVSFVPNCLPVAEQKLGGHS